MSTLPVSFKDCRLRTPLRSGVCVCVGGYVSELFTNLFITTSTIVNSNQLHFMPNFRSLVQFYSSTNHWRIQGGPNSFIFMQFSAKNWKIIALLRVGAPPRENHGSTTANVNGNATWTSLISWSPLWRDVPCGFSKSWMSTSFTPRIVSFRLRSAFVLGMCLKSSAFATSWPQDLHNKNSEKKQNLTCVKCRRFCHTMWLHGAFYKCVMYLNAIWFYS